VNRREFMNVAGLSALTTASAAGCAPVLKGLGAPAEPLDMDAYLARVDAGMAHIGRTSVTAQFPNWKGDRNAVDELFRGSMQSLYITGMFGDLPAKAQAHPGMQDRMWAAMPTMDAAADGMTAFLSSRTADDLRTVRAALRNQEVGRTIINSIDAHAAIAGVSPQRRAQNQVMLGQAEWRLRSQPPALIVNEYLDKVEKLSETDVVAEARQRLAVAQVADDVLWQGAVRSKRDERIRRGGKIMGIGVAVFVGSALLTAAGAFPFVFVATAGVVMFIVGFFILLTGLGTPQDPAKP
jgi:uncharacterized membrane protein YgdD (TMEM256/DUF423 family)